MSEPTTQRPSSLVNLLPTPRTDGCTGPGCGTQATVQLHPWHGRRCPDHMTLPAGGFRADLAADMVEVGRLAGAWSYLAAWLAREIDTRFGALSARVGAA